MIAVGLIAGCVTYPVYPVSDVGYDPDDSSDQDLARIKQQQRQAESDQEASDAMERIQLNRIEAQQLQIRQQQQREEQQQQLESYGIKTFSQ